MKQRIQFDIAIRGTGNGAPQRVLTNAEFEKTLDTSDEWIRTRTGIRERRITGPGESTLTMGLQAARQAMAEAGIAATDLDLIIFATISPHYPLPATACLLQAELGCRHIPAFDISAACSGFMFGLIVASHMLAGGTYRTALVIGSENMSAIIDFQDRSTCVLFGDGASAAILTPAQRPDQGILHTNMGCDGTGAKLIWIPAGGSLEPASRKVVDEKLNLMRMKGREVYKFAVQKMTEMIDETLEKTGVDPEDLALVLPHQSNLRIIESVQEKMGLPREKFFVNIDRYGNTSSASVGICLDEARRSGRAKPGDLVLMMALGAGLTWASALVRL